jgi:hypothetical protein
MVCHVGCKDDAGDPLSLTSPIDETPTTKADSVVMNCYLVRDAAEAFAAENNGVYPYDMRAHELPDGRTLIDFLPGGSQLVNPATGERTEPRTAYPTFPWSTGYMALRTTEPYGYVIIGLDDDFHELIRLEKRPWAE